MGLSVREEILTLKPYVPGKPIEEVKRELGLEDVIKLASNENPLGPSPKGLAALQKAAPQLHIYPDGNCYTLKQATAAHLGVETQNLIFGNGSDEIIELIAKVFLRPGQEVIMGSITFSEYEFATKLFGGQCVVVPAKDFREDLPAMARAVTPKTKLVYIGNPNNPLGSIVTQAEVDALLAALPEDAILILDEAYAEYVDDPAYPNSLEYVRQGRNVIVLRTFSKIYGLAGLRVGYGVAPAEVIALLNRARAPFNVNALAQVAATAALTDVEHLERSRALTQAGKAYLYAEFTKLGLHYVPSQANFILVDLGRDCVPVFQALLKLGVIVRTGDIFGLPTFIRVTIGTAAENQRFIEALKQVLQA